MATLDLPIGIGGMKPNDAGVYPQPYAILDTAAVIDHMTLVFDDSIKIGASGNFVVPQNYVGTPVLVVIWNSSAVTADVAWDWSVLSTGANDDMGAAETRTTETSGLQTVSTTSFGNNTTAFALTAADYVAGEHVAFELFRDGDTDTMAAPAIVHKILFRYNDV